MAEVEVRIAGRRYELACRDGEEAHLLALAAMVDAKASEAMRAMGGLGEAKLMLLAALLLADALHDAQQAAPLPPPPPEPPVAPSIEPVSPDPALADLLERLAERLDSLS